MELSDRWTGITFADGIGEMRKPGSAVSQSRFEIDPEAKYKRSAAAAARATATGSWDSSNMTRRGGRSIAVKFISCRIRIPG